MEFNLVIFFIAIGVVVVSAVIATVVAVSGAVGAIAHKNPDEEE